MSEIKSAEQSRRWVDFVALAGFLGICLGVAGAGALMTFPSLTPWYANLNKPQWNPPNTIFGPVWTTLFILMALAAWLIWYERERKNIGTAMVWFFVQLLLNCAWSGLFFAFHSPGAALLDVILLWSSILICIGCYWRINRMAACLMIPYLLWVTFAFFLNLTIWKLNP